MLTEARRPGLRGAPRSIRSLLSLSRRTRIWSLVGDGGIEPPLLPCKRRALPLRESPTNVPSQSTRLQSTQFTESPIEKFTANRSPEGQDTTSKCRQSVECLHLGSPPLLYCGSEPRIQDFLQEIPNCQRALAEDTGIEPVRAKPGHGFRNRPITALAIFRRPKQNPSEAWWLRGVLESLENTVPT